MDADAVNPAVVTGKLFRQRVTEAAEAIERRKRPRDVVAAMERDGVPPEQALAAVSQAIHAVADSHRTRSWVFVSLGACGLAFSAAAGLGLIQDAEPRMNPTLQAAFIAVQGATFVLVGAIGLRPEWDSRYRRVLKQAGSIEWSHIET
jgi:hypothetical protein